MIGDRLIIIIMITMLMIIAIGKMENNNFLLFLVSSEINFERASGNPN